MEPGPAWLCPGTARPGGAGRAHRGLCWPLLLVASLACRGPQPTDASDSPDQLVARARALHARVRVLDARVTPDFVAPPCASGAAGCSGIGPGSVAFVAAADLGRELRAAPPGDAEARHAGALLNLFWSGEEPESARRAVDELEALAETGPPGTAPGILSDLAAARLAAATGTGAHGQLLGALDAALAAAEADPGSPVALFNVAVTLEHLHLTHAGEAAWDRYLAADATSDWADEARRRRAGLEPAASPEGAGSLQPWRESAVGLSLPAWGRLWRAGRPDSAEAQLAEARAAAGELERGGGDLTVTDMVAAIAVAEGSDRDRLARGLEQFGQAEAAYGRLNYEDSGARAREAAALLGGTPLGLWARYRIHAVHFQRGQFDSVRLGLRAVAADADPDRLPSLHARIEWAFGAVDVREGRYEEALAHYGRALDGFRRTRELEYVATLHFLRSEALERAGDAAGAEEQMLVALSVFRDMPASQWRRGTLLEASHKARRRGLPRARGAILDEAVWISRELGNPQLLAEALVFRARAHVGAGRPVEAEADLAEAAENLAEMADPTARARISADLAAARAEALLRSDPAAAADSISLAIDYFRGRNEVVNELPLYGRRVAAWTAAGRHDRALSDMDDAIALVERQAAATLDPGVRVDLLEAARDIYDARILYELERGRWAGALASLERQRRAGSRVPGLGASNPDVPAIRAGLGAGAAILEFAVLAHETAVWLIRADTLHSFRVPIDDADLAGRIHRHTALLRRAGDPAVAEVAGAELFDLLVGPASDLLAGIEHLLVVPDGPLYGLPFATLHRTETGRYLVQDMAIRVGGSAAGGVLGHEAERVRLDRQARVLVVDGGDHGDPSLPDLAAAGPEIQAVAATYAGATVLGGEAASPEAIVGGLDAYDAFHFAGHAVANPYRPDLSYLVLPRSGDAGRVLEASDLANMRLERLRLVVLSACSTLAPRSARSGGINGLARALNRAGVPAVVGSLWDVEDEATRRLMAGLHGSLADGEHPAQALKAAQLALLESGDPRLGHPGQWGPFQLVTN